MAENSLPRKSFSFRKILGFGFIYVLAIAALAFAGASYLGIHFIGSPSAPLEAEATPVPSTPVALKFPRKYLGLWKSKSDASIFIRPDGKGDFSNGDLEVVGGTLLIDEKKKILKISSEFEISQTWKIEVQPQKEWGAAAMKLSGQTFRRAP